MTEFLSKFSFKENDYSYFNLEEAVSHYGGNIKRIPYTIRILIESLLRKYDGVDVTKSNIENLATYNPKKSTAKYHSNQVVLFCKTLLVCQLSLIWHRCVMRLLQTVAMLN